MPCDFWYTEVMQDCSFRRNTTRNDIKGASASCFGFVALALQHPNLAGVVITVAPLQQLRIYWRPWEEDCKLKVSYVDILRKQCPVTSIFSECIPAILRCSSAFFQTASTDRGTVAQASKTAQCKLRISHGPP